MAERKVKVLFVCVHNSARSQMAEAFLKKYGENRFKVESAGLEPGPLNPFVVEAMQVIGIDISGNKSKSVFDFYKQGKRYHYVITVCDETKAEKCPIFPGTLKQLHWGLEDPSGLKGTYDEILGKTSLIRNKIELKVKQFIDSIK